MTTCDDFQIAVERRLHRDLGEAEGRELELHLPSCPACRAYEATARQIEGVMNERMAEILRETDWSALNRKVSGYRRWVAEELVVAAIGVLATFVAVLVLPKPSGRIVRPAQVMLLVLAILAAQAWWRTRGLDGSDPTELLGSWRGRIRREVRWWKWSLWLHPAALLYLAAAGWRDPRLLPVLAAVGLVVVAAAAYDLLVRLPRVRREWSDLEAS